MCGIAGFVDSSNASRNPRGVTGRLVRMCGVIRHRGPDDEGVCVDDGVGPRHAPAEHHRSVHGTSADSQRRSDRLGCVQRRDLQLPRAPPRSRGARAPLLHPSDTETIVHAYEQWGAAAIGRLRGMFGLAIWDDATEAACSPATGSASSRCTTRWSATGSYFGSEIKSLLGAPDLPRDLDLDALNHYLSFLYTPRDAFDLRAHSQAAARPPPHLARRHLRRSSATGELPVDEPRAVRERTRSSELRARAGRTRLRSHLVSDVPLGAFLSGGLDSSLVVGLMARGVAAPVKTFSIGFDEPAFDELEHARRVAQPLRYRSSRVRREAGRRRRSSTSSIRHFDEPFADSSAIPTWYVSELARRHVTVVLSGDGGDELFGGYDRYLPHPRVGGVRPLQHTAHSPRRGGRRSAPATRRTRQEFPEARRA